MRFIGLLLVLLGGLALGSHGCSGTGEQRPMSIPSQTEKDMARGVSIPPLVSGIAVVSGLLLLVSSGRRSEN